MKIHSACRPLILIATVIGLVAGLAGGATAKPPGRGGPGGHHGEFRMLDRYADELALDEASRAAIEAIADASRDRSRELSLQKDEAREAMRGLLEQELPDEAAVMSQVEAIGAIDIQMRKEFFQAMIDIRKQLTPEQRKQLLALQNERRSKRDAMREELAASCELDVVAFCPDAETRFDRMRCMRDHRDELSPECSAAIETMKSQRRFRRGDKPGRRHN